MNPCWLPAVLHYAITEDLDVTAKVAVCKFKFLKIRGKWFFCLLKAYMCVYVYAEPMHVYAEPMHVICGTHIYVESF